MMPDEKAKLLELFDRGSRWCQDVEARDANADPVNCDAATAVAWDITGALHRLFGSKRAGILYAQIDRHIHGKSASFKWPPRNDAVDGMIALQAFNDHADTTFEVLISYLESMPVWKSEHRLNGASAK